MVLGNAKGTSRGLWEPWGQFGEVSISLQIAYCHFCGTAHILSLSFDRTYWLALCGLLCLRDRWQLPIFVHCYLLALSNTFTCEMNFDDYSPYSEWSLKKYQAGFPCTYQIKRYNKEIRFTSVIVLLVTFPFKRLSKSLL